MSRSENLSIYLHTYLSIYLATIPAVDEVRDGVVDAEGRCVQVSADLHVVSGHEAHCRLVLIVEDLPLEGGTQQQHEVIWKRRETNKQKKESQLTTWSYLTAGCLFPGELQRCYIQMRNEELGLVLKSGM